MDTPRFKSQKIKTPRHRVCRKTLKTQKTPLSNKGTTDPKKLIKILKEMTGSGVFILADRQNGQASK